jgi:hypothetical protein
MWLSSPDIDPALLELANLPIEERVFRAAPKGGQMSFLAFEHELLSIVRERLPRELAPYIVTFVANSLVWHDQSNARVEKLDDFEGWLKNMTFRIEVWPESTYERITQHPCRGLPGVVASMMLAVEHCPLELFGQNKIAEHESRIWTHGSVCSCYDYTNYINTEGTAMYAAVRNGLRKLCSRRTILRFEKGPSKGEEVDLKGTRMSEKAADFLTQFPGGHHFRPGPIIDDRRTSFRSRRRF